MSDQNAIQTIPQEGMMGMSAIEVKRQTQLIQQVMKEVMKEDTSQNGDGHYGVIPGTKKPTLYKTGAEKLCLTFRLAPAYQVDQSNLPGDHREYRVVCTMTHIPTGQVFGEGVGLCSTMEKKYRYRKDGSENENIADTYNTVLKMGKKRAMVDAILTCTAASDIFTQDLEELTQEQPGAPAASRPASAQTGQRQTSQAAPQTTGEKPQCPKCSVAGSVIVDKYAKNLPAGVTGWIHYQGPKGAPGDWKGCGHKWQTGGTSSAPAQPNMPSQLERAWAILDEGASVSKEEVEKRWTDGTIRLYWDKLNDGERQQLQGHYDSLVA